MQFEKILVVDDEVIQREVLAEIVKQISPDTEVLTAHNGEEAYELIRETKIELLLTDISMPVLNGIELSEKVSREFPEVKIVLISAYQEFEYARSAIKFGVAEYLLKPFRIKDARQMMERVWKDLEKEIEEKSRLVHYDVMVKKQEEERSQQQLKKLLWGHVEIEDLDFKVRDFLERSGRVLVLRWKVSDGKYNRRYCAQITRKQQEQLLEQLSIAFSEGIGVMQEQGLDMRERRMLFILPEAGETEITYRIEQEIEELSKQGIIFWGGYQIEKKNCFLN